MLGLLFSEGWMALRRCWETRQVGVGNRTMTNPQRGDTVRFRESGHDRLGTIVDIITAGRPSGRGIWQLRQRARIRFDADGQSWETHRDLTALTVVAVDEQPSLFADEAIA